MFGQTTKKLKIFEHNPLYYVMVSVLIMLVSIYYFRKDLQEFWMRIALRNESIVISLTTTPYRINSMREVLDFVTAEKVPLKAIYVNIPYVFKRDNLEYKVPEWLKVYPNVTILRPDDYGPGTKLLGTLALASLPTDTIVITVDDDIKYPKNMLLYLAYYAMKNPHAAVGFSGMKPHYNKQGQIITDSPSGVGLKAIKQNGAHVPILEGFAGIAYRATFFKPSVFEISEAPRECRNSDDVFLSYHLAMNNIPRQVIRTKNMNLEKITWNPQVGLNQDALHQLHPHPAERHRICVAYLKERYPGVEF